MDNKWLIIGGLAVGGVVLYVVTRSSTSSTNNVDTGLTSGITSNTGTPTSNNNSLLGFMDPASGIQWILNASDRWVAQLPAGSLPPNYKPGQSVLNPIQGDPLAGVTLSGLTASQLTALLSGYGSTGVTPPNGVVPQ